MTRRRLKMMSALLALTSAAGLLTGCGGRQTLVLDSTFDGPAGSAAPSPWIAQTGGGGWGNNELQTYTDRSENVALDGDGHLRIVARREAFTGADGIARDYTSARLSTKDAFSFQYGRVEARIQTPQGVGLWPAFWMLGTIDANADWRTAGEFDLMEVFGSDPRRHATLHGYSSAERGWSRTAVTSDLDDYTTGFHTYALDWDPDQVTVSVDGDALLTVKRGDLASEETWSFDKPMYLLLNLAVGGNQPGSPDASTTFPATMLVDSVKVWRKG